MDAVQAPVARTTLSASISVPPEQVTPVTRSPSRQHPFDALSDDHHPGCFAGGDERPDEPPGSA